MQTMCDSTAGPGSVYSEDPHLLVWDCAQHRRRERGRRLPLDLRRQPLELANFKTIAATSLMRAAQGSWRPLVLGVQEWPKNDTPKAQAFFAALEERNLSVVCGPSEAGVALVYWRAWHPGAASCQQRRSCRAVSMRPPKREGLMPKPPMDS